MVKIKTHLILYLKDLFSLKKKQIADIKNRKDEASEVSSRHLFIKLNSY